MSRTKIAELYKRLRDEADALSFGCNVSHVYNPLHYAWDGFMKYLELLPKRARVIFVGMNPGPWGMTQTGIPFGEIEAVRNFLGINEIKITPPENLHHSYPVNGLECRRSEVSGKRLWGLFRERFGSAESFFSEHVVVNYCPLLFIAENRNLTPDKLQKSEREELFALCDACLKKAAEILQPEFVIGIGNFAAKRAEKLSGVKIVKCLHPSPASPASNHDWAGKFTQQLIDSGVWQ